MDKVAKLVGQNTDVDLRTPGMLPMGSATHGAAGGALGDASMADLDKGFTDENKADAEPVPLYSDNSAGGSNATPDFSGGGFLGRPAGWQR